MKDVLVKLNIILDKKQKISLVYLFILILLSSLAELLGVSAILPIMEVALNPENIFNNEGLELLYRFFNLNSERDFILLLLIGVIIVYIAKIFIMYITKRYQYSFIQNNQRKLAVRLLNTYLKQPYIFHVETNSAELVQSVYSDTISFYRLVQDVILIAADGVMVAMLGVMLFVTNFEMTMALVVLVGSVMIIYVQIVTKKISKYGKEFRRYQGKMMQWLQQALGGIKESKILQRESFFSQMYEKNNKGYAKSLIHFNVLNSLPSYLLETVCIVGVLFVLTIQIIQGKDISTQVPQLAVFVLAAFKILPCAGRINGYANDVIFAKPAFNLIYADIMKAKELKNYDSIVDKNKLQLKKEISIENLTFLYPNAKDCVLENVNMVIPKNCSVAFVGTSGAGKTTLADIILGLLKPQKGSVFVDGVDIYENIPAWLKNLGYIPQNIYLTDDTIRNNIAFGIEADKIDEDAVQRVVKEAQLEDYIKSLPDGLDTYIGEGGIRMSGGQRQRIGIARALYTNPEILVLDEATSALDTETETAVMEAIESLSGSKTIIIIAHRLSTIENCDIVYEVGNKTVIKKKG